MVRTHERQLTKLNVEGSNPFGRSKKAKIKEMIKLATARMDEYLGGLCDVLSLLPDTSEWKARGQKCKDIAKPLKTRCKSYV